MLFPACQQEAELIVPKHPPDGSIARVADLF